MADRKFFSGLTEGMMRKHNKAPDRQQTNFFWPNETEAGPKSQVNNQRPKVVASETSREPAGRSSQQNQSSIRFFDTESSNGRSNNSAKSVNAPSEFVHIQTFPSEEIVETVIERPAKNNSEPFVIEHKITMT